MTVEAEGEDQADELAHGRATEYLGTVMGNHRDVGAYATLDGVGADEVKPD